jgi:hypothetical protein
MTTGHHCNTNTAQAILREWGLVELELELGGLAALRLHNNKVNKVTSVDVALTSTGECILQWGMGFQAF